MINSPEWRTKEAFCASLLYSAVSSSTSSFNLSWSYSKLSVYSALLFLTSDSSLYRLIRLPFTPIWQISWITVLSATCISKSLYEIVTSSPLTDKVTAPPQTSSTYCWSFSSAALTVMPPSSIPLTVTPSGTSWSSEISSLCPCSFSFLFSEDFLSLPTSAVSSDSLSFSVSAAFSVSAVSPDSAFSATSAAFPDSIFFAVSAAFSDSLSLSAALVSITIPDDVFSDWAPVCANVYRPPATVSENTAARPSIPFNVLLIVCPPRAISIKFRQSSVSIHLMLRLLQKALWFRHAFNDVSIHTIQTEWPCLKP